MEEEEKKEKLRPLGFYCTFLLLPSELVDGWVMLGLSRLRSSILQHPSAPADAIASVRMDNFDFFIIRFEFSSTSTALLTVLGASVCMAADGTLWSGAINPSQEAWEESSYGRFWYCYNVATEGKSISLILYVLQGYTLEANNGISDLIWLDIADCNGVNVRLKWWYFPFTNDMHYSNSCSNKIMKLAEQIIPNHETCH